MHDLRQDEVGPFQLWSSIILCLIAGNQNTDQKLPVPTSIFKPLGLPDNIPVNKIQFFLSFLISKNEPTPPCAHHVFAF